MLSVVEASKNIHTFRQRIKINTNKPLAVLSMVCLFWVGIQYLVLAQDYYNTKFLRYDNHIYIEDIKTVKLHRAGFEMSDPVIDLKDTARLVLSFDDFGTDLKNYTYTVIHCDANWQPSDLNPFDYIEGFQEQYIRDYSYSFGTITQYTHYTTVFPSDNFKLLKSGNYLLKVYVDEPDSLVLTRKFMISDLHVTIKASIKRSSIVKYMDEQHEVDFS